MDFLIKNTKGLTLKTKGKYCTEDLVINIDQSLVEGYMEVDELPEVGLPRVLYKLMLEEPEYYIWENEEWVQLNTKISGANIVSKGGTAVPNSGFVENVYFNTSLSEDEYYNILNNITFTDGSALGLSGISFYAVMAYMNNSSPYVLGFMKYAEDNIHFGLINFSSMLTIQNFFMGEWEVFDNPYSINNEVLSSLSGLPIGTENDKLINLISTTPFENQVIKELSGDYEAVDLEVTENTTVDVGAMLDEGKIPMSVTVNVGGSGGGESTLKKLLDTTKSAYGLFSSFEGESIDDLIKYDDTENVTYMNSMCEASSIVTFPLLNTSKVKNIKFIFSDCEQLVTVSTIDMANVITDKLALDAFYGCYELTNLTLLNIKVNLDLSQSEKLTLDSLINTVKELINVGSSKTLTMGTTNLSKVASTYVKFTDSSVTSIPTNEKGEVEVCESTDTGAMLLSDYALLKNWTLA